MTIKRIGVLGAGAIGSVVGGMMARAGHDVTLDRPVARARGGHEGEGLRLSGTIGDFVVPVRALHIHELQTVGEPFDAVFVAVKSYDTEWAVAMALPYLREPDGVVVDFQNGINDSRVAAVAGKHRSLGCVITISAGMYEPGHAMRTDTATVGFKIGEHDGADTPRARELAGLLTAVAESQGHDQPLGRALVEARHQLHGEPALGPHRPRHAGRADDPGDRRRRRASRRGGDRRGARRRARGGAHLRHPRGSATSTPTRGTGSPSCSPTSRPSPARGVAVSRASCRTC